MPVLKDLLKRILRTSAKGPFTSLYMNTGISNKPQFLFGSSEIRREISLGEEGVGKKSFERDWAYIPEVI